MITKIIITQKKGKTAQGLNALDLSVEFKPSPAGGDISSLEAARLLTTALEMTLNQKTAKKEKDAQG
jgi:hypothetical protein